jgi:hypothetical protein
MASRSQIDMADDQIVNRSLSSTADKRAKIEKEVAAFFKDGGMVESLPLSATNADALRYRSRKVSIREETRR